MNTINCFFIHTGTTKEDFYASGSPIKVEILGNKYGGNKLHYKGHMYTKLKAATERVWWRCIFQKKCKGMMVTLPDYTDTKLAILRQGHTHRADPG